MGCSQPLQKFAARMNFSSSVCHGRSLVRRSVGKESMSVKPAMTPSRTRLVTTRCLAKQFGWVKSETNETMREKNVSSFHYHYAAPALDSLQ
jgi:hypothetical protein